MIKLDVFTDGGCSGNPGPGGWAFAVIKDGNLVSQSSGGSPQTTNNIMELTAVISAVHSCSLIEPDEINIHTDSQYVKNGITDWINKWKINGWKTAGKDPVKNQELWQQLDELNSKLKINWIWVKGHAGIKYNELCDSLVRQEMQKYL